MNAAVAVSGFARDGAAGAKAALARFWKAVSDAALFSPVQRNPLDRALRNWSLDGSPGFHIVNGLSRAVSPCRFNPWNLNPLLGILEAHTDFEALRGCGSIRLFIPATCVETGKVTVFHHRRLTAATVMASACRPHPFEAVELDGRRCWDGGYAGNPVLSPLFEVAETRDILIVQINPVERAGVPTTAHEIEERINEITFNASLLAALRAIGFVPRLPNAGTLEKGRYRKMRIHILDDDAHMNPLGASSKLNAEWAFLTYLNGLGRDAADRRLRDNWQHLGVRSSLDIGRMVRGEVEMEEG